MHKRMNWSTGEVSVSSPIVPVTHKYLHALHSLVVLKAPASHPHRDKSLHSGHRYLGAVHQLLHRPAKPRPHQQDVVIKPPIPHRYVWQDELEEEEDELEIEDWHEVVHAVAELQRQHEKLGDAIAYEELEHAIDEAMNMILAINAAYGWESGEPVVVDRMFGINVRGVLAGARKTGVVDFKTRAMINTIRSVGRSAEGGRSKLAMVAAVRNLVGGLTSNEAKLLADAERLGDHEFVTMVHDADKLSEARQLTEAHHLGPHQHQHLENETGVSIADERARMLRRSNL